MYVKKLSVIFASAMLSVGLIPQNTWGWGGLGGTKASWDELANCTYAFENWFNPPPYFDANNPNYNSGSYNSTGEGTCTWTVTKGRKVQSEVANCKTSFNWPVTGTCVNHPDDDPWSEAIYTGDCQAGPDPFTVGTVDCSGGRLPQDPQDPQDPLFCKGTNCEWNEGFGSKQGNKITGMTTEQCEQFGDAFTYTETFEGLYCNSGIYIAIEEASFTAGHSHSWNSSDDPYVDEKKGQIINNAATNEQGELKPVGSDIDPQSFSSSCTGTFTVRLLSIPEKLDQVPFSVEEVDVDTVAVNDTPVVPGSCNLDQSPGSTVDYRLSCSVPRCDQSGVFVGDINTNVGQALFTTTGNMTNGTPFVSDTESRTYSASP